MIMEINYAKRDEILEIAAFLNACWKAEYSRIVESDFLDDLSVDERHKLLLTRFDEGNSVFLIMRDGERMVGASVFGKSFTEGYPDDGEVSAIYLHHDYIGKGHGYALFKRIERELVVKGYSYFVLDVLSGNLRAVSFYKKHGYEKVNDRDIKLGARVYPLTVFRKKNPFTIREESRSFTEKEKIMQIKLIDTQNIKIAVIHSDTPLITDGQSALDFAVNISYEHDCYNIVVNKPAVAEDFFKLSTGIAGEVVQKLVNYGYRLAIIGDFSHYTSKPLRDYIYECNKGRHLYFVSTEQEAVERLGYV